MIINYSYNFISHFPHFVKPSPHLVKAAVNYMEIRNFLVIFVSELISKHYKIW